MGGVEGVAVGAGVFTSCEDLKQWVACLCGLRLEIILLLAERPRYVGELTRALQLDYSRVSHTLAELRQLRCVKCERNGVSRLYRLSHAVFARLSSDRIEIRLRVPGQRALTLELPVTPAASA